MTLYDGPLYDESLYDAAEVVTDPDPTDLVEFGKAGGTSLFSLSDGVQTFVEDILDSGPEAQVISYEQARANGIRVVDRFDRAKIITIPGWIQDEDLFDFMDEMKRNLRHKNGYLYITKPGQTPRQYVATLINYSELFSGHRGSMVGWSPYIAKFLTTGYSRYKFYTSVMDTLTLATSNITASVLGSAEAKPVCVLIYNTAVGITEVMFRNDTTGEEITLETSISSGDVVIFDSENLEVTLNGVVQDYVGVFPKLDLDDNTIQVIDDGSSRSADVTLKWKPQYR